MTSADAIYAGSSITYATSGYRSLTTAYLRQHYLALNITEERIARSGAKSWNSLWRLATISSEPAVIMVLDTANNQDTDHDWMSLEALIRRGKALWPTMRQVVMLFPALSAYTDEAVATPSNAALITTVKALCAAYGVSYVDYYAEVVDRVVNEGAHVEDYFADVIHPNASGHALAASMLEPVVISLMAGAASPSLSPTAIYDTDGDYQHDPVIVDGVDYDSRTGTWTDTGTEADSSEVGATITFSGMFSAYGIEAPAGYDNPAIEVKIDDGDFASVTVTESGVRIGARAAHTIIFRVASGTVKILRFVAI